ncbi:hypothetical protein Q4575_11070 [Psychrosphaera sp. 1_MG-2023]|uniref:winged helix-turn-helix domain-containing protein n=1 Tax=Psychrosphaera sp. 1_MG-2023 TaxID=3062643 RepID=UPI0026E3F32E|nr:hypothetical protein [Psychrosphaera sp. 1_MG-2023]MDO6719947.1 hypothetical protein [Psychrosphaera sp. 1_MG-2023]
MLIDEDASFQLEKHCIYCLHTADLIVNGKVKCNLDNLESLVFLHLIKNKDKLVTYEDLHQFWNNRYLGEGVITRVISNLRTKLRTVGCLEIKILNKHKRGYILTGPIAKTSNNPTLDFHLPRSLVTNLIIGASLIVMLAVYLPDRFNQKITLPAQLKTSQTLLAEPKLIQQVAISPSQKLVAYASPQKSGRFTELKIINRLDDTKIKMVDNGSLYSPVWLSEYQLLFRAVNQHDCFVKQVELSTELEILSMINLFRCNEKAIANSLSLYKQNKLLLTNASLGSSGNRVSFADLTGQACKAIEFPELAGQTIYNIITHENSPEVFLLATSDWQTTNVIKTSIESNWQTTWQITSTEFLKSAAWNGKDLIVKHTKNSLMKFTWEKDILVAEQELELNYNLYAGFHSPIHTKNGVVVISDNKNTRTLSKIEVNSRFREKLIELPSDITFLEKHPKLGLLFKDTRNPEFTQLSTWNSNKKSFEPIVDIPEQFAAVNMSIDPTGNQVAIESDHKIVLANIIGQRVDIDNSQYIEGDQPRFISNKLFLHSTIDGIDKVLQANTFDLDAPPQYIATAKNIAQFDNNLIYSHQTKLGIWKHRRPFQTLLLNTNFRVTELLADDNILYFKMANGEHMVYIDGQKRPAPVEPNEHIADIDDNYLYAVAKANGPSELLLLK